jgi:5-formyltetrahydrofolate cyclo-ligase
MSDMIVSASKSDLRSAALARRDALDAALRDAAAKAIAARGLPFAVPTGTVVAGYAAIRSELDPGPLMTALAARGAVLALPVVIAPDRPLVFRAWQPEQPMQRGQLGNPEPSAAAPDVAPDIVLVPLAAFDRRGHRLGYGGGHYDRTLAQLRNHRPVVAIGLAFAAQEVDALPALPHDALLDLVLTEQATLDFRRI